MMTSGFNLTSPVIPLPQVSCMDIEQVCLLHTGYRVSITSTHIPMRSCTHAMPPFDHLIHWIKHAQHRRNTYYSLPLPSSAPAVLKLEPCHACVQLLGRHPAIGQTGCCTPLHEVYYCLSYCRRAEECQEPARNGTAPRSCWSGPCRDPTCHLGRCVAGVEGVFYVGGTIGAGWTMGTGGRDDRDGKLEDGKGGINVWGEREGLDTTGAEGDQIRCLLYFSTCIRICIAFGMHGLVMQVERGSSVTSSRSSTCNRVAGLRSRLGA